MSQKNIDFGNYPDDPDADSIRVAFQKVQDNFTQLFAPTGAEAAVTSVNRTPGAGITVNAPTGNVVISANIACVQVHTSTLSIGRGTNGYQDTSITSSSQVLWVDLPANIENVTNLVLDGNANIGGYANVVGNIYAGNANLGNAVSANYFIGDGGFLSNVSGGGASLGNLTVSNVTLSTVNNLDPIKFSTTSNVYTNWIATYGNTQATTSSDYAQGVAFDSNNNVFMIGTGGTLGTMAAPYIVKYNSSGEMIWQKVYSISGASDIEQIPDSIKVTSDNNLIVSIRVVSSLTTTYWYPLVIKIDGSTGEIIWSKQLVVDGPAFHTKPTVLCLDSSDNIYCSFTYRYNSNFQYMVQTVKLNSSGVQSWANTLNLNNDGVVTSYDISVYGIAVDLSGNVYITGERGFASPSTYYSFIAKINSSGSVTVLTDIADTLSRYIAVDSSSNVYITGPDGSDSTISRIVKLNSSLVTVWGYTFGNIPSGDQVEVTGINIDTSNNVYVVANGYGLANTARIIKINSSGVIQWQNNLSATGDIYSGGNSSNKLGDSSLISTKGTLVSFAVQSITTGGAGFAVTVVVPNDGSATGTYGDYTYSSTSLTLTAYTPVYQTLTYDETPLSFSVALFGINQLVWDYTNQTVGVGTPTVTPSVSQFSGAGNFSTPTVALGNFTVSANVADSPLTVATVNTVDPFWFDQYGGNLSIDQYTDFWMYCEGVASDSNGNVYAYGGNDGDYGLPILVKYDANGTLLWQKSITYDINAWLIGDNVYCDSDDNVLIVIKTGDTTSDPDMPQKNYLVKLDTNGTILWQRSMQYPTPFSYGTDVRISLALDLSNNIYVVNVPNGNDTVNSCVLKYNSSGTLVWQTEIIPNPDNESPPQACRLRTIHVDSRGYTFVGVESFTSVNYSYIWILDDTGTLVNEKRISSFYIRGIQTDSLNNYYVAGEYIYTGQAYGSINGYLIKFDSSDAVVWSKLFYRNSTSLNSLRPNCLKYKNNSLYLSGSDNVGTTIMSIDASTGDTIWQNSISVIPEYQSNFSVFNWYYDGIDSLITITDDSVILALCADGPNISDMMPFKVPLDGSGTGIYGRYSYSQTSIISQNDTPGNSNPGVFASISGSLLDDIGTNTVSDLTYANYLTQLYPTGSRNWSFDSTSRLTFPDGTVQSTAFNPTSGNTYIYSLETTNIKFGSPELAIGLYANASLNGVSIGRSAGQNQSDSSAETIAIGSSAQSSGPGFGAIGIGTGAGLNGQSNGAISLGYFSGAFSQGPNSIAIGYQAGYSSLGSNSIVIGYQAGYNFNPWANTIILNATGSSLVASQADTFIVKPIRQANTANALYYNASTGEITYDTGGGGGGGTANIPQATFTSSNYTLQLTDSGKFFYSTSLSSQTAIIPNNSSVTFTIGTVVTFVNRAAASMYINAASGTTLYLAGNSAVANRIIGPYGQGTILQVATDTWVLSGIGIS